MILYEISLFSFVIDLVCMLNVSLLHLSRKYCLNITLVFILYSLFSWGKINSIVVKVLSIFFWENNQAVIASDSPFFGLLFFNMIKS